MVAKLRHVEDHDFSRGGELLDASSLPDSEKERMCHDLLAEFGANDIRPRGDELVHGCLLPYGSHTDQARNPTASLNFKKLTYNCFSCGGGGLLWFVGIMRGESSEQARAWLRDKTGIGGEQELSSLLEFFDKVYEEAHTPPPIPKMSPIVLEPWLVPHPYREAFAEMRRIPLKAMDDFKVGYGLVRVGHRESERIIIPHFWKGDLVGWQSRRLTDDGTPKYLSSSDFPKDRTIFNYDDSAERVVIVESPMSVLSKAHHHLPIEATFGPVTDRQLSLLKYHPTVILFMDNDATGWKQTRTMGEYLIDYCNVLVADNPYAADAADMDDDTYLGVLNDSIPYALWSPPEHLIPWE